MDDQLHEPSLSDTQKREVCSILALGCDRFAAAKYAGCSLNDIRQQMLNNAEFSQQVHRAEAGIEMTHMHNVRNAARDEKHWRASVWWLERTVPDRYGRRDAEAITRRQLEDFMALVGAAIVEDVHDEVDRERLLARLQRLQPTFDDLPAGSADQDQDELEEPPLNEEVA